MLDAPLALDTSRTAPGPAAEPAADPTADAAAIDLTAGVTHTTAANDTGTDPLASSASRPLRVVAIFGSPDPRSRSTALARAALLMLPANAQRAEVDIRALPAQALLLGNTDKPALANALQHVRTADLVLIGTPIYKAAYSGVLKLFLDLLPADGLRGKRVLPLATGGSVAHLLAVDYALRPVLAALGAREVLDPVFATETQFEPDAQGGWVPDSAVRKRIRRALGPWAAEASPAEAPVQAPVRAAAIEREGAATAAC